MTESVRTTVKCLDPGDGSGDVIVELPDNFLRELGLTTGDILSIELINGGIVLKPVRECRESD
ncbi:AbrB family transcriptional regulator [Pseudomonas putida]|jgi:antitoxin component of MazEF toxin-antitoxin module|uniref:AbrB family transcriptional regulator n=1 Tax=Pseudomonas putida TaxID=303 RepID=A0A2S3WTZ3_PSEPU|nr:MULTISPECIES: AbrB/MazE/SpoVT family DNA-binding domain-containing protein [Pseudomonas]AXQ50425.1 AbrB/MazE/SpoVT family DNA-binding domain-containing protein [Stenotrophomonas rhizophila]MBH3413545.1 AbrB/MazE/SpoVT family DNA-binding domain-containing protein [Pseudomonas putida]MBS3187726.1 AbrB/MazE/SpoVT family DNA-binding domain-containing protein [Pseudomonas sp. PCH44]PIK75303.1 AbrB family transcriptional regulator [Pseudomonas sp. 382]POG04907.1 AbrB family transcriptional regula